MGYIPLLAGPMLLLVSGVPVVQAGPPQSHEQHQATTRHAAPTADQRCCCEEMMRKMMSEMMQKHQGTAASKPGQQTAGSDEGEHKHPER